jgi:hypothetical protein
MDGCLGDVTDWRGEEPGANNTGAGGGVIMLVG